MPKRENRGRKPMTNSEFKKVSNKKIKEKKEFLEKLKDYDSVMQDRYETAKNNNLTLRYIASIDIDNNIFIGLKEYPIDHPFSNIQLTDNIIKIQSDRYADNPLIVQGPGAGPGVTAAGISADIINLIKLIK